MYMREPTSHTISEKIFTYGREVHVDMTHACMVLLGVTRKDVVRKSGKG
jgi:hypothetical protein